MYINLFEPIKSIQPISTVHQIHLQKRHEDPKFIDHGQVGPIWPSSPTIGLFLLGAMNLVPHVIEWNSYIQQGQELLGETNNFEY